MSTFLYNLQNMQVHLILLFGILIAQADTLIKQSVPTTQDSQLMIAVDDPSSTYDKGIPARSDADILPQSTSIGPNKPSAMYAKNTSCEQTPAESDSELRDRVKETLKENAETIRFMENKGQLTNSDVLYYYESMYGGVYIERNRIRFVAIDAETVTRPATGDGPFADQITKKHRITKGTHTFSMYLDGANPGRKLQLGESFNTNYNYIQGQDPNGWVSGVKAAKYLTLEDVYPGIDLRLYSNTDGSLEFDWILDAGADYSKLKMRFEGQDNLAISQVGSLNVGLRFTDVKFHIPESYQVTDRGKVPVDFAFSKVSQNTISFATQSPIDPRFPVVIDPILSWGTFMDGNLSSPSLFDAYLYAIEVDPSTGIVYCAGATNNEIPHASAPYDADGYQDAEDIILPSGNGGAPYTAVVYRISANGSDLLDLTHYGPTTNTWSGSDEVVAHALSLSPTRVFIGGTTTEDIPTTGSPFDGTRNGTDGFVAVFSRDLGSLIYATYLGGTGAETRGVTSIRALSDVSFVVGLSANDGSLPTSSPNYFPAAVIDNSYSNDEMYIAKFGSSLNGLTWGTYVGGSGNETFNDLEVFADGRIAFAGSGTSIGGGEVNSAAAAGSGENGIIGVLSSDGTAFNYVDIIGGNGTDAINDVQIVGNTLYFTGSASDAGTDFPTTANAYRTTPYGNIDVVVGKVNAGGSSGYAATFYGTGGDDIGSGIRIVSTTNCAGVTTDFLLVFGTVEGSGLPTLDNSGGTFYQASRPGGLDMFFGGFNSSLTSLTYGTYMGGSQNDYLGDTGSPRGANHLWVDGANVYLGTTTHSASHSPTLVGGGGFDPTKDNPGSNDDAHIIFSIEFGALIESDYSDAPSSYGTPFHNLDCSNLRIGTNLDSETGPFHATAGNDAIGDDNNQSPDDEDGISSLPTLSVGGPQNITITVNNIVNSTGSTATLYAWIDLNSNGIFSAGEMVSTTVANGFSGSKMLTWTGVTVSGSLTSHYLRLRLTTNTLADNVGTASVDERSTISSSDGEVEDYQMTVSASADLSITKTDGSATYTAGTTTIYTVVVGNAGPSGVTGATVADNAPAGTTITGWTATFAGGATGTAAGAGNINQMVNIPSGGSVTYTITLSIPAGFTGNLSNTATVTVPGGTTDPTPGNNSATDTDTPAPQANLGITKTDGNATYTPGVGVTYTVVVSNAGPSNAVGATVTDNAPAGTTITSWSASFAGGASGTAAGAGNINQTVNIPVGGSITYTINVSVPAGQTGNLVNTATVNPPSGTTDPTPGNNSATDTDTPNPQADLSITKTDGNATYTPGVGVTYTVVVSNAGPSNAVGATVVDNAPAGTTITSWSASFAGGASGTAAGAGNISQTVNIPVGGSITYTINVSVPAGQTGNLVNTATVNPPSGTTDPNPGNNSATDTNTPALQADLSITKTDGKSGYTSGMVTIYTVVVSNAGPSNAVGATVVDNAPAGTTITGWTAVFAGGATGTAAGSGNINQTVTIPVGGTITYTITIDVPAGFTGNLVNTATVNPPSGTTDPTPGNNSATDTDTPNPQADLSITKTDGNATYTPGVGVTYTVVVSNAGPSNAVGATVTDNAPAGTTITSWTAVFAGGATGTAAGAGNINQTVNIPVGGSITYTINVSVPAGQTGNLVNTATVNPPSGTTDPAPGNNSATDTNTPALQADLSITKTDGNATYTPGVGVTYTVVVSNTGPSNAVGATVVDNAPAGTTITSWTAVFAGGASGTAAGAGNINQTVNIPVGGSITYTINVSVPAGQTGNLVNTATVNPPSGTTDPTPGNNSATDTDTPNPQADLSITKTDGNATYTPGVGVTYTVVVSNAGPSNAVGATVVDNAPAGTTITSWSASFAGGASGTAAGAGNISQTVNIPVGGSITYTINVSVPAGQTGNLVNTATVNPPSGTTDPNPGNNSATDTNTPALQADLSITKTDGSATYTPGVGVTYTVVVSNSGPSNAVGATVVDNAPAGTTITSWSASFAGGATGTAAGAGNINQTVNIPVGGSITYTINVSVPAGQAGNLVNTATVNPPSGTTDPNPGNNSATDTNTPAPQADLSITKTDGSSTYTPGVGVTYTVVVSNTGPSNAVGATVVDNAPAGTTITSWTASFAGGATGTAAGAGNISQTVNIPVGGSITYTINVSVPAGQAGNLVNTATVNPPSGTTDPNPGNNSATDTNTPAPQADLSITKTDGSSTYTPGVGVTYTVVVSNTGPSNAVGATVVDNAPAGTTITSWSASFAGGASGTAAGAGNISQTVNIPVGGSITYTINVSVPAGQAGNLVNTATVNPPSGTTDPNPGNNSATDTNTQACTATVTNCPQTGTLTCSQAEAFANNPAGLFAFLGGVVSVIPSGCGTVNISDNFNPNSSCGGTHSVTFTITYTPAGGTPIPLSFTQCVQPVQVIVQPAPLASFSTLPGNTAISCTSGAPVPTSINYSNGQSGSCQISGSVLSTISGGTQGACGGSYTETWTFTDACGRTISHSRTLSVSPPPVASFVNLPGNMTINCGSGVPSPTTLSYSNGQQGGICAISGSVTSTVTFNAQACPTVYTETWTFTDACGRTITHSRTVTVNIFWENSNIGAANGGATYSCSQSTPGNFGPMQVTSAGYGSPTSDIMHFVYARLSGDGTIIAKFNNATNQGFGGIMFRESLAPGSRKASLRTQNSLNNVQREVRQTTNGAEITQQWQRLHKWLRMDKIGNIIAAYTSPDGINWWSCPSHTTVLLGDCFYVGIYAEGINVNSPTTATFDVVRITGFNQLPAPLAASDDPIWATDQTIDPGSVALPSLTDVSTTESMEKVIDLHVYPNPVLYGQELTIEVKGVTEGRVRLSVHSLQGVLMKTIWIDNADRATTTLDVSEYADGIYLIRMETDDKQVVTKKVTVLKN